MQCQDEYELYKLTFRLIYVILRCWLGFRRWWCQALDWSQSGCQLVCKHSFSHSWVSQGRIFNVIHWFLLWTLQLPCRGSTLALLVLILQTLSPIFHLDTWSILDCLQWGLRHQHRQWGWLSILRSTSWWIECGQTELGNNPIFSQIVWVFQTTLVAISWGRTMLSLVCTLLVWTHLRILVVAASRLPLLTSRLEKRSSHQTAKVANHDSLQSIVRFLLC